MSSGGGASLGDAKNMVMTVSEDDEFSWTPPKWTNIWGYPAEMINSSNPICSAKTPSGDKSRS